MTNIHFILAFLVPIVIGYIAHALQVRLRANWPGILVVLGWMVVYFMMLAGGVRV